MIRINGDGFFSDTSPTEICTTFLSARAKNYMLMDLTTFSIVSNVQILMGTSTEAFSIYTCTNLSLTSTYSNGAMPLYY